ncbi:MAG: OadG family protein [Sulfuricurvum sp.]|jgi:oxaloacetate decarboxylase gamma subunit|uniref:OadG family protein n=1 Tax=Sulfuricurvum sp. TaxID=2025608 RepID=UPI0025DEC20F|nr:OadG family transporter subunit [Sulfuricurvum sp.]MCK9373810.1 OadG family protein [Sulfuricurvum sp.]
MFFESIKIMLLGMGTVFLFLTIMVYMIKLMSKLILRYFPEAPKVQATVTVPKTQTINENAKIAAILGALQHHHQLEQEGKI